MWTEATPEKRVVIESVAKAFKENDRFGSIEMGGNGYCYECFLEPARPDHYNCDICAGKLPTAGVTRSLEQIKLSLREKISKNTK